MYFSQKTYNIFTIPLCICFVLYAYIFIALINSGYFYAAKILVFTSLLFLLWVGVYIVNESKRKLQFSLVDFFSVCTGFFLGFWYVKTIWFRGYLNLDPMATILNEEAHIDTLMHSAIAESFVQNGYPSVMLNDCSVLHYHTLSHCFMGYLSKCLDIPCLITYNFLYPIIFLPLYVLLLQCVLVSFRRKMNLDCSFRLGDILFLLCFVLGFNFFGLADKASLWFKSSMVDSESNLVSIILMLICFVLVLQQKNKLINGLLIIPCFIFLIPAAKINTGTIFFLCIAYYLFRSAPKSFFHWGLIFIYIIIFVFSFFIFCSGVARSGRMKAGFFCLIKLYLEPKFWVLHYGIYILPALLLFRYGKEGKFLSIEYLTKKSNLWPEMAFLLTVGSWIPGILLNEGGDAIYFYYPAFVISTLILWSTRVFFKMSDMLKSNLNINIVFIGLLIYILCTLHISFDILFSIVFMTIMLLWIFNTGNALQKYKHIRKYTIFIFLLISLIIPELVYSGIFYTSKRAVTISNEYSLSKMRERNRNHKEKLLACFSNSDLIRDNRYKMVQEIRSLTRKSKKDWCLFLSEDCYLSNFYSDISDNNMPHYGMKAAFVATSLFGIPVINALYSQNGILYRWDEREIGFAGINEYYGISSVRLRDRVNLSNAMEYANRLGKKKMIILGKNGYSVKTFD